MTPIQYIKINGAQIAFKYLQKSGNKETVVFLHDSLGCITLWRDFPEKAFPNHNILLYDRIGYGASSAMKDVIRPNNYLEVEADFLIKILSALQITKPILFGHSDGGTIALIASAKHPSAIKAIITEGAHIYVEDLTLEGINDARHTFETTNLKERLTKYHKSNTQNMFDAWIKTWHNPEFRAWNIVDLLPKIQCPALIVQGEDDEFGSIAQVEDIMFHISSSSKKALLVPNAKHTPHKENQEAVLAFLKENMQNLL